MSDIFRVCLAGLKWPKTAWHKQCFLSMWICLGSPMPEVGGFHQLHYSNYREKYKFKFRFILEGKITLSLAAAGHIESNDVTNRRSVLPEELLLLFDSFVVN